MLKNTVRFLACTIVASTLVLTQGFLGGSLLFSNDGVAVALTIAEKAERARVKAARTKDRLEQKAEKVNARATAKAARQTERATAKAARKAIRATAKAARKASRALPGDHRAARAAQPGSEPATKAAFETEYETSDGVYFRRSGEAPQTFDALFSALMAVDKDPDVPDHCCQKKNMMDAMILHYNSEAKDEGPDTVRVRLSADGILSRSDDKTQWKSGIGCTYDGMCKTIDVRATAKAAKPGSDIAVEAAFETEYETLDGVYFRRSGEAPQTFDALFSALVAVDKDPDVPDHCCQKKNMMDAMILHYNSDQEALKHGEAREITDIVGARFSASGKSLVDLGYVGAEPYKSVKQLCPSGGKAYVFKHCD